MNKEEPIVCECCEDELDYDNGDFVIHAIVENGEVVRQTNYCNTDCMVDFLSTLTYLVHELSQGKSYEEVMGENE